MTDFSDIKTLVSNELSDVTLSAAAQITVSEDDDATRGFRLPHSNTVATAVYIDDALKTVDDDYTVDERAGIVTFDSAPGEDAVIDVHYTHTRWHEDDVGQAINDAVYHSFPAFYVCELHTDDGEVAPTTYTTVADTYEYEIRSTTEHVASLDWRSSSSYPWSRLRRSRYTPMTDSTDRYIRFHDNPGAGYFRVHAITRPSLFTSDACQVTDTGLPERAVRSLVLCACYQLLNMSLASRVRSDVAISTQGEGSVPPYEVARAANAYLMAYQAELERVRMPPWSTR